jgi:hypothetical protein
MHVFGERYTCPIIDAPQRAESQKLRRVGLVARRS